MYRCSGGPSIWKSPMECHRNGRGDCHSVNIWFWPVSRFNFGVSPGRDTWLCWPLTWVGGTFVGPWMAVGWRRNWWLISVVDELVRGMLSHLDGELVENWTKIGRKLVKNWSKIGQKLVKNWSKTVQKLVKNWLKISQKLIEIWIWIWSKLVEIGRKLVEN